MSDQPPQTPVVSSGEFRVGRVLSRSLEILLGDFVKFLLIAFLAVIPDAFEIVTRLARIFGVFNQPQINDTATSILVGALGGGVAFVFYALSAAATLCGAFQSMRGVPFRLTESLGKGLARFFPIVGVSILSAIVVGFGFALLIVPGFMWFARFYVALPACVMEELGPVKSMDRSADLTRGHRWQVFGIYLIVILISSAPEGALITFFQSAAGSLGGLVAILAWHIVFAAYNSIVIAVIYYDLRVLRDGIDIDRIAAVFD